MKIKTIKFDKKQKEIIRAQKKKEKEEKRAQKRAEKEHKKEIERLNRMLIPVSKKTYESLGIISFDSKVATLRQADNKWLKTYKIEGLDDLNRDEFIDELVRLLPLRTRITSNFSEATDGHLIRTNYITFFTVGEIYESVKLELDDLVDRINQIFPEINLVEISSNCLMNQIRRNFLNSGAELDFDTLRKRKNNWKDIAFKEIALTDDYFEIDDKTGVCMQVIQFPGSIDTNFLSVLLEWRSLPMMFITDIQPLDEASNDDFRRVLEKRFNRKVEEPNEVYANIGFTLVLLTDDKEKKEELIADIEDLFSQHSMIIAPVYGNTADVLESSFSYGIKDYHSMRNLEVDQVKRLIV